jgi:hypothetical protein
MYPHLDDVLTVKNRAGLERRLERNRTQHTGR